MRSTGLRDECARDNRKTRFGRDSLVVVALACVAMLAVDCSGGSSAPGVASLGSSTKATTSSSKGSSANPLVYAACMRSHGEPDFPDPDSSGGFAMPSNIDPNSPQYEAAANACKAYAGSGLHLSPARQEQIEAEGLKFAQCMRSHGVPNFADPTFNFSGSGVSESEGSPKSLGIAPSSPTFQAAQKTCQSVHAGLAAP
jgi:hypothetical protein